MIKSLFISFMLFSGLVAFSAPKTPDIPGKRALLRHLFTIPPGSVFAQQGPKLVDNSTTGTQFQGWSTSISADGNTAVVGGYGINGNIGSGWIYSRFNGIWTLQTALTGTGAIGSTEQGSSVAISADGLTAVVGGRKDNGGIGAVWVYINTGGTWSQQGLKLVGSGSSGTSFQGVSTALSSDGNTLVVGGMGDNGNIGAVWVYTRSGGIWTQQGAKLTGTPYLGAAVYEGAAVSVSADGNTLLVGANGDNNNIGAAWAFTRSAGSWSQEGAKILPSDEVGNGKFGLSVSITSDASMGIIGGSLDNASIGAAWIFNNSGTAWAQAQAKLVGSAPIGTSQQGVSVSISNDASTAIVGGWGDNNYAGAIWVYTKTGSTWAQNGPKVLSAGTSNLGYSVGLSSDGMTVIAGETNDITGTSYLGASIVFAVPYLTPTVQATNLLFTNTTPTSTTTSYTVGNGTSRLVFIYQGSSPNPVTPAPADATTYIANSGYGAGSQIGTTGWYCVYNGTANTFNLTGLTKGTTYQLMTLEYNGMTATQKYLTTTAPGNPASLTTPTPTITYTGSLAALTTVYGTASGTDNFLVSGNTLSAGITATAPAGYEVSLTSGSGFANAVTVGAAGTIAPTAVYIRLTALANASSTAYTGNVTLTSVGAPALSGPSISGLVNPRPLVVSLTDTPVKLYGQSLATVLVTGHISTGANSDYITGTTETPDAAGSSITVAAGTAYSVMPSLATGNSTYLPANYTITYSAFNSTVTPAPLVITASNVSRTYGTVLTTGAGSTAFTSATLQNGEKIGSVTMAYATANNATDGVSTNLNSATPSAATGGTFTASNYSISYVNGNLSVIKAPLTITGNTAKVYGTVLVNGSNSYSFTPTGLMNNETANTVTIAYGSGAAGTDHVGFYMAAATPSFVIGGNFNAANYAITYAAGIILVMAKPLYITANVFTKTYGTQLVNGANFTGITTVGLQNAETIGSVNMVFGTGSAASASVGAYAAQETPSAATGGTFLASNYTLNYYTGNIIVGKQALVITASTVSKAYGATLTGAAGQSGFSSNGLVNSENIGSVTLAYGSGANAAATGGTYTNSVTPSLATGGTFIAANYLISYVQADLMVSPANLYVSIAASAATKIYGTSLTGGPGSSAFTPVGLQNGDKIGSITITYNSGGSATSAVGNYSGAVVASGATGGTFNAANYTISYVVSDLNITPYAVLITANNFSKIYGQTVTNAVGSTAFTYPGLQNGETINSVSLTYGTGAAASDAAGTYLSAVVASAPIGSSTFTAANYAVSYVAGAITVTQAPLTITAQEADKVFGIALTGGPGSSAFTYSGLMNSETIGSVTLAYATGAATTDAVGTYTNSVTASAALGGTFLASNYSITYTQGNIVVSKALLLITASPVAKVYGLAISGMNGSTAILAAGLQNGDNIGGVTIAYGSGSAATDAAGIYSGSVTASNATGGSFAASNYQLSYAAGNLTVSPKGLIITAGSYTKIYGATLNTAAGQTTFSSSGLTGSDLLNSVTLTYGSGSAATTIAGTYPGSVIASSPIGNVNFNAANYAISYVNATLTISPAPLTITPGSVNKTYGTQLMGAIGSSVYTSAGLLNGENIGTITLSFGSGSAATASAGIYPGSVTTNSAIGGTFSAANYVITYNTASILVNPAPILVGAIAISKVYGTALGSGGTSAILTQSGLMNSEVIDNVMLSYAAGAAATAAVGVYPLSIGISTATGSGFQASNYTITYTGASINVTPAGLSITTGSVSKSYGSTLTGASGFTAFSSNGLKNSETISSVTTDYGTGSAPTAAVGSYPGQSGSSLASGGSFTASNYTITYNTAAIIVNPAALTITATGPAKTYGSALSPAASALNFITSPLVNGEVINTVVLTPDNAGLPYNTPAGINYIITPSAATGGSTFQASNYIINYFPFTGIVDRLPLLITATGPGKVYGTTLPAAAATPNFKTSTMASGEAIQNVILNIDAIGQSPQSPAGVSFVNMPSGASGNTPFKSNNYIISYASNTSLVTPAPLIVSALSALKLYGVTLTASPGSGLFSTDGLQNNETATTVNTTVGLGQKAVDPVGIYQTSIGVNSLSGGNFLASNYAITYLTAPLTIVPSGLVITAHTLFKTYGQVISSSKGVAPINANGSIFFTALGLLNNETIGSITSVIGSAGVATAAVGTYSGANSINSATGGTFLASNYSISYVPSDIIITKATLSILALDVNKNYGSLIAGSSVSTAFTASGLQNAETIGSVSTAYGTGSQSTASVGVYAGSVLASQVTGGNFSLNNYTVVYYPGNIIVGPAALNITPAAVRKPYGTQLAGLSGSVAYSISGLQNSETAATITVAYGPGSAATDAGGTYAGSVIASKLSGGTFTSSNYTLNYNPAQLLVGTQSPTISIVSQPDCSTAFGSFSIPNYNAAYTYSLSAPGFTTQVGAVFTAPAGTYTMTALAPLSFLSPTSISFTINPQPPLPKLIITNPLEVNAPAVVNIELYAVTALSDPNLVLSYFKDIYGQIPLLNPTALTVSGVYFIKGTNSYGCTSPLKAVYAYINPQPKLVITNPLAVNDPSTVDITAPAVTAGSTPGLTYTYFADSLGTIPVTNPTTISVPGIYYIRGTNGGGNSVIGKVRVTINYVIFIPNIFTPNGDGKNDRFEIVGLQHFPGSSLLIYNRWGNTLYHSENYQNTWDGGGQQPGTYYYVLLLKKAGATIVYKGWVQILH